MLGFKLFHVSKRGHRTADYWEISTKPVQQQQLYWPNSPKLFWSQHQKTSWVPSHYLNHCCLGLLTLRNKLQWYLDRNNKFKVMHFKKIFRYFINASMSRKQASFTNAGAPSDPSQTRTGRQVCYMFMNIKRNIYSNPCSTHPRCGFLTYMYQLYTLKELVQSNLL